VWLCNLRLNSWLDDVGGFLNDRWLGAFDAFARDFGLMLDATRGILTAHHVFNTAELPTGTAEFKQHLPIRQWLNARLLPQLRALTRCALLLHKSTNCQRLESYDGCLISYTPTMSRSIH
jgi:hypothetical protein